MRRNKPAEQVRVMKLFRTLLVAVGLLWSVLPASAQSTSFANVSAGALRFDQGRLGGRLDLRSSRAFVAPGTAGDSAQSAPEPVAAVEYSTAYQQRAKIHKLASLAMIPLFVTEGWLGQSIYNNPTDGKRSAHGAVAGGIAALFAVNTVTGVWNMVEARHDPSGRGRRRLHGFLMLAADAGFLATAMLAPDDDEGGRGVEGGGSRSAHRAMAFTAISTATVGYLVMLIGGH